MPYTKINQTRIAAGNVQNYPINRTSKKQCMINNLIGCKKEMIAELIFLTEQ